MEHNRGYRFEIATAPTHENDNEAVEDGVCKDYKEICNVLDYIINTRQRDVAAQDCRDFIEAQYEAGVIDEEQNKELLNFAEAGIKRETERMQREMLKTAPESARKRVIDTDKL